MALDHSKIDVVIHIHSSSVPYSEDISKRQPNNVNCKRLHNLFRNRVNREIKKSKKRYYEDYFTEHVNNIKKTWDGIKKIVNLKKHPKELLN